MPYNLDPEGIYFTRKPEFSAKVTVANTGNPEIRIKVFLTHFLKPDGQWEAFAAPLVREVRWSLHGGAVPYTTEKLKLCGFNFDFENPAFDEIDASILRWECKHNTSDKGKTYSNFDLAGGKGQRQERLADAGTIKALNAAFASERRPKSNVPPALDPPPGPEKVPF